MITQIVEHASEHGEAVQQAAEHAAEHGESGVGFIMHHIMAHPVIKLPTV